MIQNRHERVVEADADLVGELVDGVGQGDDRLWPAPAWMPMRLDRPVSVGADGGHGPIRYAVVEHEPRRRVRFQFHPGAGLHGYHELVVVPLGEGRCLVRHDSRGSASGAMRLLWPLAVRWLHDAVLEDLLDNAEREATGSVAEPATWSWWVRFLRRHTEFPWPTNVAVPERARLVRAAFERVDLQDAWQVRVARGVPTDPQVWADAVFHDPPRWVCGLMRARNALVGLVGIARGDSSAFVPLDRSEHEVLLGADERHLDFRGSVLVDDRTVTLSTVVRIKNRRGRLYLSVVWPLHGLVVRSMLRRAQYSLSSARSPGAAAPGPPPMVMTITEAAP